MEYIKKDYVAAGTFPTAKRLFNIQLGTYLWHDFQLHTSLMKPSGRLFINDSSRVLERSFSLHYIAEGLLEGEQRVGIHET